MPRAKVAGETVECCDPLLLDKADIVKIDCEGSEADIVENLQFTPAYMAIEYHSSDLLRRVMSAIIKLRMECVERSPESHLGIAKFVRVK